MRHCAVFSGSGPNSATLVFWGGRVFILGDRMSRNRIVASALVPALNQQAGFTAARSGERVANGRQY